MSLWENIKGEDGRNSLTENITPRIVKVYCPLDKHEFEIVGREAICKICGMGSKFIPGLHKLVNGKIKNAI